MPFNSGSPGFDGVGEDMLFGGATEFEELAGGNEGPGERGMRENEEGKYCLPIWERKGEHQRILINHDALEM
ncbi:Hypothetical predicted protein, partial [Olea europaea subsp. europaea]